MFEGFVFRVVSNGGMDVREVHVHPFQTNDSVFAINHIIPSKEQAYKFALEWLKRTQAKELSELMKKMKEDGIEE